MDNVRPVTEPFYRACKNQLIKIANDKIIGNFCKKQYKNLPKKEIIGIINDAVYRVNIIVFHTYNFLKLYLIHLYDQNKKFPDISVKFVYSIMKIVSIRNDARGRKSKNDAITNEIKKFFDEHYKPLINENDLVSDDKLSYILKTYECVDIIKNIKNNIKEHFISHVKKYIGIKMKHKSQIFKIKHDETIKKETKCELIRFVTKTVNNIISDVFCTDRKKMISNDPFMLILVNQYKKEILPNKKYKKNNIFYDIEVDPLSYLYSMITINRKIQAHNVFHKENHKLFHPLPLRTSILPRYITIDTCALISLFSGKASYFNNAYDKSREIWSSLFNLDLKCFKRKGYKFANMIKTDGVACSIILEELNKKEKSVFKKIDLPEDKMYIDWEDNEKPIKKTKKKFLKKSEKNEYIHKPIEDFQYIDDINIDLLRGRKIVTIDPGHNNLIYATSINGNEEATHFDFRKNKIKVNINQVSYTTFRYTRNQRNHESKKIRYQKIINRIKTKEIIKMETKFSKYNSHTCDFIEFKSYLKAKIELNRKLYEHYYQSIYRKLKFNRYINTNKSETKMIKNFKEKFGNPNEVVIIFGDYSKSETMKKSEPHIVKRIKNLFKQNKYKVYLIDEYNTSKKCHKCGSKIERFKLGKKKNDKNNKKTNKNIDGNISENKKEETKGNYKKFLLWRLLRPCKNIRVANIFSGALL